VGADTRAAGAGRRGAGAKPNFTGTYAFVQKRSDDLREAIGKAVGPTTR
jgi:hypothetical protein